MFSIRRAVLGVRLGVRRPLAASRFFGSYKSIASDAELTKFMDEHKAQDKLVVVDWFATWYARRMNARVCKIAHGQPRRAV